MPARLAFWRVPVDAPEALRLEHLREPAPSPHDDVMRLFAAHGPALYRFCLFVTRHRQDAEDVVQDTFVKLLHHVSTGGARTNLQSWLFTVAANGCRDRQRGRMRWLPWRAEEDRRAVPVDVEAAGEEGERHRALLDSARHLRPRDRLLLMLRVQGLSYREIAAAAAIPEASVGRLLARARERWRRGYQELHGERS